MNLTIIRLLNHSKKGYAENVITEHQTPSAAARLSAAGLRSTAPRRAVLDYLSCGGHHDAKEVFEALHDELPGSSLQAVYIVLGALASAGLLRKIEPAGGSARYEARIGDNHHHLVCRSCGQIEDVDCAIGAAPCLTPSETHGFVIDEAEVIFHGLCATCNAAA